MSPNMFSVTRTSKSHGERTRRSPTASTYAHAAGTARGPPRTRERKGKCKQAFARAARDEHRVADGGISVALGQRPRREQSFGRFAHEYAVDLARPGIRERCRRSGQHTNRPHAGVELEPLPEIEMRGDFRAVGVSHVRQAHRAEQDRIRPFGAPQGVLGQGDPGCAILFGPRLIGLEPQPQPVDPADQRVEQREARRHDFAADAVTRKHRNPKLTHAPSAGSRRLRGGLHLCRHVAQAFRPARAPEKPVKKSRSVRL
jgi:hypothetical protein